MQVNDNQHESWIFSNDDMLTNHIPRIAIRIHEFWTQVVDVNFNQELFRIIGYYTRASKFTVTIEILYLNSSLYPYG